MATSASDHCDQVQVQAQRRVAAGCGDDEAGIVVQVQRLDRLSHVVKPPEHGHVGGGVSVPWHPRADCAAGLNVHGETPCCCMSRTRRRQHTG